MKLQLQSNVLFLFVGTIQSMWIEANALPAIAFPKSGRASASTSGSSSSSSAKQPQQQFSIPIIGTKVPAASAQVTTCSKGKKLPHPDNPNKFFQCQFISKADVWLTQPYSCPSAGHVFDEAKQACIDRETGKPADNDGGGSGGLSLGRIDTEVEPTARSPAATSETSKDLRGAGKTAAKEDAGDSLGIIAKLASALESLASTVQTLSKNNENLAKVTVIKRKDEADEFREVNMNKMSSNAIEDNERDEFLDNHVDAVFKPIRGNANAQDSIPSTQLPSSSSVLKPHTILLNKNPEKEQRPFLRPQQQLEEEILSSESTEENISASAEDNKNPFENSLLKMWMMNFLPKPKIMHPFTNSHLLTPATLQNMKRYENLGPDDFPSTTTTKSTTEPVTPLVTSSTAPSTTTASTSTSASTARFPAFEYHYIHQPQPKPTTIRPLIQPLPNANANSNNVGGNLINLFSLFKRLTSSRDEDGSNEDRDHDHRFPFSNPPSPVSVPVPTPQRLINSNSNPSPFIFHRIPMSASSTPSESQPNNSNDNHVSLLQHTVARTPDKSPADDSSLRRPRQPRKQN